MVESITTKENRCNKAMTLVSCFIASQFLNASIQLQRRYFYFTTSSTHFMHNYLYKLCKWWSSGLLRRVVFWLYANVPKEHTPSIFSPEEQGSMFLWNVGTKPNQGATVYKPPFIVILPWKSWILHESCKFLNVYSKALRTSRIHQPNPLVMEN
jgi:hypothetical protein